MVRGEDRGADGGEPVVHMADVGAVLREKLGDGDLTAVAVRCVECCSDFLAQTIFCECMRVVHCIRYDRVAVLTQRGDFEFEHGVLSAGLFIVVVEKCDFHGQWTRVLVAPLRCWFGQLTQAMLLRGHLLFKLQGD